MKKKILFLMTLICLFMISNKVEASTVQFYEAEKIDNIYTKSVRSDVAHFQKARFFRRSSDNKAAYCIEPFEFFDASSIYDASTTPQNIDNETWKRMSLIAYYGYNYKNHTDAKWYAITQLLIWQEAEKQNSFYFTDTLNGNRIDIFNSEIEEIKNLVSEHEKLPSFKDSTFNIKKGTKYIYDQNDAIKYFKNTEGTLNISENKIDISNLSEGHYTFHFERQLDGDSEPVLFYYNSESQNLMTAGSVYNDKFTLTINIYDTNIKLTKIDKDTNSKVSLGNGKLCDGKFELYNSNKKLIKEFKLNDNCEANFNNLDLGKYYIREKEAGEGYILDNNFYEVNLTLENTRVELQLANEIIKKEVTIHKDYGSNSSKNPEKGVVFHIYSNGKLVDIITTDQYGNAKITLPYGEYTFKQVTSSDGYNYVEDFKVLVTDDEEDLSYTLMDYLIQVPDTRSDQNNGFMIFPLLLILLISLYGKKICIH